MKCPKNTALYILANILTLFPTERKSDNTLLTYVKAFFVRQKQEKKAFKYVKRMLPLFRAMVKFCSTNRLFT